MKKYFNSHRLWFRVVATGIICLFVLNDISYALEPGALRRNVYTLSPPSAFNPLAIVTKDLKGKLDLKLETAELSEDLKEKLNFQYVSRFISWLLTYFDGSKIDAEGLKKLLKKHFPDSPGLDLTGFKWDRLSKEGDIFYLPYAGREGGRVRHIRFYLSKDQSQGERVIWELEGVEAHDREDNLIAPSISDSDLEIFKKRYLESYTLEEVASLVKLSPREIRHILRKIRKKIAQDPGLKEVLKAAGFDAARLGQFGHRPARLPVRTTDKKCLAGSPAQCLESIFL
ncbi:MAG: hypothetical protein ABID83_01140, partial [Candidatus Omnitrophota bacterium]